MLPEKRKAWRELEIPPLTGRALVTGAASGIGFETSRALAERGAQLLLVDRNETAGQAAAERIRQLTPKAQVLFMPLDLGSLEAIRNFTAGLLTQGQPLDWLINCAGLQPISQRRTTQDGFELTFGVGHLGHFALTGLLLPLLWAAKAARVVTVSSVVHGQGRIDWDDLQLARSYGSQRAYNQTKLANLLFARELQRRLSDSGSRVLSLAAHPGVARTGIGAARQRLGSFGPQDHLVSAILLLVMPLLGQPARKGALPVLYAATSPEVKGGGFYGPKGFGELRGPPGAAKVHPLAQNAQTAQQLWERSEALTGVHYTFSSPELAIA